MGTRYGGRETIKFAHLANKLNKYANQIRGGKKSRRGKDTTSRKPRTLPKNVILPQDIGPNDVLKNDNNQKNMWQLGHDGTRRFYKTLKEAHVEMKSGSLPSSAVKVIVRREIEKRVENGGNLWGITVLGKSTDAARKVQKRNLLVGGQSEQDMDSLVGFYYNVVDCMCSYDGCLIQSNRRVANGQFCTVHNPSK